MLYTLIFTIATGYGISTSSAEFSTKELCLSAASAYKSAMNSSFKDAYAICVQSK